MSRTLVVEVREPWHNLDLLSEVDLNGDLEIKCGKFTLGSLYLIDNYWNGALQTPLESGNSLEDQDYPLASSQE